MSLETLSRIIQEFFGSIPALLYGTPHDSHAIVKRIGNRAGCARSLVSRFRDVFSRSFHDSL